MSLCLVTGGAGFVGSHVARHLIGAGHSVLVLDDLSGGFGDQVPSQALFVEGSIQDHAMLSRLFSDQRFDYVYHLAACAAEGLSHFIKRFNYENNLVGSVNLINESVKHRVKCFVFTSSIAVYGSLKPPMREEDTPHPEDPYGIAKLAVEQDLRATHKMFGLPYVIFRPHNVYGEHQNLGDRYRNVVGIFVNQLMHGKPLTVFGDGLQTRGFTYIDDVAPWIARAPENHLARNETFNIGADEEYSVKALAEATMEALGIRGELRHVPARQEVIHAYADHGKARRVFGASSRISLREGLGRMALWARNAGIRKSRRFEDIEIEQGLPAIWHEER